MKRALFRAALASLALYGCAAVLGIDDLPVPDADDGGGGSDSATPIVDARAIDSAPGDSVRPELDAGADADADADADVDADADAGAGPIVFAIQPTPTFDPSAVFWDPNGGVLYIADNDLPDGGTIWSWDQDSGVTQAYAKVPLTAAANLRFGQIAYLSDRSFFVPEYATDSSDAGAVYNIDPSDDAPTRVMFGNATYTFVENLGAGVYLSLRTKGVTEIAFYDQGAADELHNVPDGSVGFFIRDGGAVFVAESNGKIEEFPSSGPATTVASNIPAPGFMVDGPDGSFLVGSGASIRLVTVGGGAQTAITQPDGGLFVLLGAFAYDDATRRLFVPQGKAQDAGGSVLVMPLP